MASWFVFVNQRYYPWGETVEADTPEEAVRLAEAPDDVLVSVYPAESRVYFNNPQDDD